MSSTTNELCSFEDKDGPGCDNFKPILSRPHSLLDLSSSMKFINSELAMSGTRTAGASRRIDFLDQITYNIPTSGIKRSHSVKTNVCSGALRKLSFGGCLSRKCGELKKGDLALQKSE